VSEEKQKIILRTMIRFEPRNIEFFKLVSTISRKWIYPDLGIEFDCNVLKSVLNEIGL
jgi:hypothetical protein